MSGKIDSGGRKDEQKILVVDDEQSIVTLYSIIWNGPAMMSLPHQTVKRLWSWQRMKIRI